MDKWLFWVKGQEESFQSPARLGSAAGEARLLMSKAAVGVRLSPFWSWKSCHLWEPKWARCDRPGCKQDLCMSPWINVLTHPLSLMTSQTTFSNLWLLYTENAMLSTAAGVCVSVSLWFCKSSCYGCGLHSSPSTSFLWTSHWIDADALSERIWRDLHPLNVYYPSALWKLPSNVGVIRLFLHSRDSPWISKVWSQACCSMPMR